MHNKYVWSLKIAKILKILKFLLGSRRNVQEFTKRHLSQVALQVAEWRLFLRQVHKGREMAIQKHTAVMKDTENGFSNKYDRKVLITSFSTDCKSQKIFSVLQEKQKMYI